MSLELSGLNSLAYLGVLPTNPPRVVLCPKVPGANDKNGYSIGDIWIVQAMNQMFMLVSLAGGSAVWRNLYPGGGGALIFNTDSGIAIVAGGELNMFGNGNISTSGSGDTITISLSNGTNGQLLIGGGSEAAWASMTSNAGTVTITPGVNTLNLEVDSPSSLATSFVTDDTNVVMPDANNRVNIVGGSNINTSGAGSTVTINLNDSIIIPGTITISSLIAGVVQSSSAGLLSSNYGTNGQLLISSSSAAPAWHNITSTGGSVTITNTANHINLDVPAASDGTGNYQFMAQQTANLNTVIGNIATLYYLGSSSALSVIFDVGGNVYPGSGAGAAATFTAPVTGAYYLAMCVNFNILGGGGTSRGRMVISTTKRDYTMYFSPAGWFAFSPGAPYNGVISHCAIANMSAGDQAMFFVNIGDATPGANFSGIYNNLTYISGYFLGA